MQRGEDRQNLNTWLLPAIISAGMQRENAPAWSLLLFLRPSLPAWPLLLLALRPSLRAFSVFCALLALLAHAFFIFACWSRKGFMRHEEAETEKRRNGLDHIISQSISSEENHGGLDDPRPLHGHGHRHPLGGGGGDERRR